MRTALLYIYIRRRAAAAGRKYGIERRKWHLEYYNNGVQRRVKRMSMASNGKGRSDNNILKLYTASCPSGTFSNL